jgi:phage gp46-like protein
MAKPTDLKLTEKDGYYDISFGTDGDFELTEGIDTSLITSFFTDKRAAESEVFSPEKRRGWWGTLFNSTDEEEIGSKIWLLFQETNQDLTLNDAKDYARDAFQWMIDKGFADKINISGSRTTEGINLAISTIKGDNITKTNFKILSETV